MRTDRRSRQRERGRRRLARDWPDRVGLFALLSVVVLGPQLFGGRNGGGISLITGLAALSVLSLGFSLRRSSPRYGTSTAWGIGLGLVAWTALQAAPLPRGVVEWLQPEAVDLAAAAAGLLGDDPPSFLSISISPHGTQQELVKWLGTIAAFFAGWMLALGGRRERVLKAVGASVVLMALVALAHKAAGAERIFGLVDQGFGRSPLLAPLANPNHLSGFLAMGVPLLMGLGLESEDNGKRGLWLGAATVCGVTALLCVSRGGVAALGCGLLAMGIFALARRRGRRPAGSLASSLLLIGASAAVIAGLGLYVAFEAVYRDFEQGDLSKLELAAQGLDLALDHPWLGVGRGAFSAAFVAEHGLDRRFTHPENFLAHWASEWGLVVAVGLVLTFATAFARKLRKTTKWAQLGGLAALTSIAVHDLVDFAAEMAGVAVVLAALAGALFAPRRLPKETGPLRPSRRFPAWSAALALGVAGLAAVGWVGWRLDARDTWNLQAELTGYLESGDAEAFRETLETAIRIHPSEPAFPLLAGAEATRRNDPRAIPWLNRAMVLASGWSAPHLEAARYLAGRGRLSQAYLEIEEAESRRAGSAATFACSVLSARPESAPAFVRAAGDDEAGLALLDRVARCLPVVGAATRAIDDTLREHAVLGSRIRDARRALAENDPQAAVRALEPMADTRDHEVRLVLALAFEGAGEPRRAVEALANAERWAPNPSTILRARARACAAAGMPEEMRETTEALRGLAAGRAGGVADAWLVEGNLEHQLGNDGRAMQAYERSHRIDPEAGALARVARLAEDLGSSGRAYRAYTDLCQRHGPQSRWCADRDRLHARLRESSAPPVQLGTP